MKASTTSRDLDEFRVELCREETSDHVGDLRNEIRV